MTIRIRFPGDIEVSTKFFGRFTARDLVKGVVPVVPGLVVKSIVLVVLGLLVGGLLVFYRPYGKPVESVVFHFLRQYHRFRGESFDIDVQVQGRDDVVVNGDLAAGVLKVTPVNVSMRTDVEQASVQQVFETAIASASYPVKVYSRQEKTGVPDYVDHLSDRFEEEDGRDHEQLKSIIREYGGYCQQLSQNGIETTEHYVVLPVPKEDTGGSVLGETSLSMVLIQKVLQVAPDPVYKRLYPVFEPVIEHFERQSRNIGARQQYNDIERRCQKMESQLNRGDLQAERVTGSDLRSFADKVSLNGVTPEVDTWKAEDGTYYKSLAITEFPSSMELAWPRMLFRVDGFVDITQVVSPRNPADTAKLLERRKEKLAAERESFLKAGMGNIEYIESRYDDAEWMLDQLADREDRPFDYACYVTVCGDSYEECEETFQQVVNRLRTAQIEFEKPVFETDRAAETHCPVGDDSLDQTQLLPGAAVSAGFPFATRAIDQDMGVIYGADTDDETPILLDRFEWDSHSLVRIGTLGSGKSYATKLELLRMLIVHPNLNINVIDPKLEYTELIESLGGKAYNVTSKPAEEGFSSESRLTCYVPPERGSMNMEYMTDLLRYLQQETTHNEGRDLVIIDEARHFLTDDEAVTELNNFVLEARDIDTAVTMVTQNASHFTHSREGMEILKNVPATVFMRHDTVDEDVVEFFGLSQREASELLQLKTGKDNPYSEALYQVDRKLDAKVRVSATDAEDDFIEERGVSVYA